MPTGYTAKLYEGTDQSFEQFALEAARAMGAAIMQRDDPTGPIADEYEPSTYEADWLAKAKARLVELQAFMASDWKREERENREKMTAHINDAIRQAADRRVRYETMLVQVQAWEPPTSEHVEFKKFMVDQLVDSIKFDCSTTYLTAPSLRSWTAYRTEQLAAAQKDVDRAREQWQAEQDRTAGRNKWVRDLRESLAGV